MSRNAITLLLLFFTFLSITNFIPTGSVHHPLNVHGFNNFFPPSRPNATLAGKYFPGGVSVYNYYSSEPAPMGIADYGIGPNGPFIRTTTQFEGKVTIYNLSAVSSFNTPWVTFQLNVVLNYQYNGNTYALWAQDVAWYNTFNHTVTFEDNVWNMTAPLANVTGVVGNGGIYNSNSSTYYAYGANNLPGSYYQLPLPGTFYLLVNVSVNSLGQPVIYFWYNDGFNWVEYDAVTVANVRLASNVYFMVNGFQYTGDGHYYDAELVMGGPGSGSSAYIFSSSTYLSLFYWNGHNFQGVANAYNFGSDTAETVSHVIDNNYYYLFSGELLAGVTAGNGTLGNLWESNTVSTLTVTTGVQDGYVLVYNDTYPYSPSYEGDAIPFVNGSATLTLFPTNYAILVYNSLGQLIGEANDVLYQGEVTSTPVTQFSLSAPVVLTENSFSFSIPLTIYAYGSVSLSVVAPPGVSYTSPTQTSINGVSTEYLDVTVPGTGTYNLTIIASLFPGFSVERTVEVVTGPPTALVKFSYQVMGLSPPTSPTVTLEFPNGTIMNFVMPISLTVPVGTTYSIQQIIGTSQGIRWALPSMVQGSINGDSSIEATYYEQFLTTFNFEVQGGQGYGNPTVGYNYFGGENHVTAPATVWVDYNSPYSYSQTLPNSNSQERWISYNYSGVVSSPKPVTVLYNYELYVNVISPIPVYALVNGSNVTLSSGWYVEGTSINVENLVYYVNNVERYVIASVSPSGETTVNSPLSLTVNTLKQYFLTVDSSIPVYALVNGSNVTLSSGWYNSGTRIEVENLSYYPSQGEREVIVQLSPSSLTLTSPDVVKVKAITQYYVNLTSDVPVYALVNGSNTTLKPGWYNKGTSIQVENITYYPTADTRYVMVSVLPSESMTLNGPSNVFVNTLKQYFLTVDSSIPVYALVNGSNVTLTSGWYNSGTRIEVENLSYYVSSQERYLPTSISPTSFTVGSPSSVSVSAVKQYLVTINGISSWYDQGSTVTLNAAVPIYEVGKFVGTDNVSPGSTLVVNGPIEETLVESPNYGFLGSVGAVVVVVAVAGVLLTKKKPGKSGNT
ncbi:hypothetical protein GWK48_10910 [Metallosphaera tengchongensis]|uniref:Thermopsin n=1 Tax=Metallosphaera tengchongensis TaxID=1532350 RepID=A0A6N0NX95_9CREN|nr:thermopsin [Metallosphaera tengchongensis]QKR00825.1 hypothetical protein GWK48_10910 [Metallosphaera tengchongensis]